MTDIFDIQEAIAEQIAATIEPEVGDAERHAVSRKPPNSLDAGDCYQRGFWHLWGFTTPGFDRPKAIFSGRLRPIRISHAAMARSATSIFNVRSLTNRKIARRGWKRRCARGATRWRSTNSTVSATAPSGCALCLTHQNDEALVTLDVSLELNPSFAQAHFAQGFNMLWHGREIEAETLLDRATMLSPRDSHISSFHHVRSWAHFSLGEYDIAVEFARRATRQPNVTYQAFASLAASLGLLGEQAQAKTVAAELLQRKPNYDVETARQQFFFCNDPGLRRAFRRRPSCGRHCGHLIWSHGFEIRAAGRTVSFHAQRGKHCCKGLQSTDAPLR